MQVGDTLRTKRTELKGRLAAIVAEAAEIQAQVVAIDRVIAIYEPEYVPDADAPLALPRPVRKRQPRQRVLPEANKRQAVLEVLRDAARPMKTGECAAKVGERHGIAGDDLGQLSNHLSATLDALVKSGRIRQAGTVDGRRHLWEIAA